MQNVKYNFRIFPMQRREKLYGHIAPETIIVTGSVRIINMQN